MQFGFGLLGLPRDSTHARPELQFEHQKSAQARPDYMILLPKP